LHELAKRFGNDGAKAFWDAGSAAINLIESIVNETGADCEFRRVPGYLHNSIRYPEPIPKAKEIKLLQEDAELAMSFGYDAKFMENVPLVHRAGVRFANQAKFHPRKYLNALLRAIPGEGSYVFEETAFDEVLDKPFAVRANGKSIHCDYVILATHNPLMGRKSLLGATLLQTKLSLYTSYVLGARLPPGTAPEALFWDTSDPYDYLRIDVHRGHQYAIFGGEDVKTGQEDDISAIYARLKERLVKLLPNADVTHRWMGQVIETDDGLPFIGENADRQFLATGFSGNGFTLGTIAAVMARDRLLRHHNPWADLFRVDRKPFHGGLWRYLTENADFPSNFLRDRFTRTEESIEDVRPGQGKIVMLDGEKVAAYRSDEGNLMVCSPVCTHMKCLVGWNGADKTWDCPCHGSRFHTDGSVLSGPAELPLEAIDPPAMTQQTSTAKPRSERANQDS
ncbi:MAG TPA: FAD-dependent oxidoreductase, partial [Steroidobacteraceae bacterium]|nr:FAD-dependent oxidoreductase [Steroidobacteraceae bacterium]